MAVPVWLLINTCRCCIRQEACGYGQLARAVPYSTPCRLRSIMLHVALYNQLVNTGMRYNVTKWCNARSRIMIRL
jgi:hypothetical protein